MTQTTLNELNERLKIAAQRDAIAIFNDDTSIEEDLAALYLCVSTKTLGEMRGNGGGPVFVKPQQPKATGRNQPVSYVMKELRIWREQMSASSNLQIAHRQGLVSWTSVEEPFWLSQSEQIINSAIDQNQSDWADRFIDALTNKILVRWMTPQRALELVWQNPDIHNKFAAEFISVLRHAEDLTKSALAKSSVVFTLRERDIDTKLDQTV
jgi:hypothetical protein